MSFSFVRQSGLLLAQQAMYIDDTETAHGIAYHGVGTCFVVRDRMEM